VADSPRSLRQPVECIAHYFRHGLNITLLCDVDVRVTERPLDDEVRHTVTMEFNASALKACSTSVINFWVYAFLQFCSASVLLVCTVAFVMYFKTEPD
jgi:hypothetical protein